MFVIRLGITQHSVIEITSWATEIRRISRKQRDTSVDEKEKRIIENEGKNSDSWSYVWCVDEKIAWISG